MIIRKIIQPFLQLIVSTASEHKILHNKETNSHESYFHERELTRSMRFTCCLIYVNCLYLVLRDINVNILNSLFCLVKFASSPFQNIISFAFRYNLSFKFLDGSGGRAEHWAPIKCI